MYWSNDKHGLSYSSTNNIRFPCIPDTFAFHRFFQLNYILNLHGSLLDLIFCNNIFAYIQNSIDPPVKCEPYHPVLSISYSAILKTSPVFSNTFYMFKKANFKLS